MDDLPAEDNEATPRRSLRRGALTELNEVSNGSDTPKTTSPDEQVIIQRGPRRKPITWSPYEYNRTKILGPPRDRTPEKYPIGKPEINSKLRRRLVMTPEKNPNNLGETISKRLRSFTSTRDQFQH